MENLNAMDTTTTRCHPVNKLRHLMFETIWQNTNQSEFGIFVGIDAELEAARNNSSSILSDNNRWCEESVGKKRTRRNSNEMWAGRDDEFRVEKAQLNCFTSEDALKWCSP